MREGGSLMASIDKDATLGASAEDLLRTEAG